MINMEGTAVANGNGDATKFSDMNEAVTALKREQRRILTQFEGDLKMSNLTHAGPFAKDVRKEKAKTLLLAMADELGKSISHIVANI